MTDYGHELQFGTFISPAVHPVMRAVELTIASDEAGLDLATFQDHPYQPTFYDTWTLMAFAASRTKNIHLSGNVLNLPLRQPAVLARSAASLDLLTKGRFELGIGAGAFWDGVEAMGGRRLTAGQAVSALEEAIHIIREIWNTDERSGVRVDGDYYQVKGAKRGPRPAHDIGIWIGAYKPKMLNLTGRMGDGWLPSLAYLEGGLPDLTEMNRIIDEGAESAGRKPSDIRRMLNISGQFMSTRRGLLNGPVKQWVEELAEINVEYGISGFILGVNEPYTIDLFAREVAPAVRELAAHTRVYR